MALRGRTVRLSDRTWELVREEANVDGISSNEWIREAVVARVAFSQIRRRATAARDWARIERVVRDLRRD